MDPNKVLKKARAKAERILNDDSNTAEAQAFAEHFQALDEWLSNGGFLPEDWRALRLAPAERCRECHLPQNGACPHDRKPDKWIPR